MPHLLARRTPASNPYIKVDQIEKRGDGETTWIYVKWTLLQKWSADATAIYPTLNGNASDNATYERSLGLSLDQGEYMWKPVGGACNTAGPGPDDYTVGQQYTTRFTRIRDVSTADGFWLDAADVSPLTDIRFTTMRRTSPDTSPCNIGGRSVDGDLENYHVRPTGSADLAVTVTASPTAVTTGGNITYTITVTNNGPDTATSVNVLNYLPPATSLVTCSATGGGICISSGNKLRVSFDSIEPGSQSITIVTSVSCLGSSATNVTRISSVASDTVPGNNFAVVTTVVASSAARQCQDDIVAGQEISSDVNNANANAYAQTFITQAAGQPTTLRVLLDGFFNRVTCCPSLHAEIHQTENPNNINESTRLAVSGSVAPPCEVCSADIAFSFTDAPVLQAGVPYTWIVFYHGVSGNGRGTNDNLLGYLGWARFGTGWNQGSTGDLASNNYHFVLTGLIKPEPTPTPTPTATPTPTPTPSPTPSPTPMPTPAPQKRPLIFIPGITGSRLDDSNGTKIWPPPNKFSFANPLSPAGYTKLSFDPNSLLAAQNIIAPDVIRSYEGEVYSSLISMLTDRNRGGYVEYQVNDQPQRRRYDGCDLTQSPNNPTLFVFAYDWRKSGIEIATALKEYVRCVQRFYPNTDVDIIAHSQGGLIARRYIIVNSDGHHVKKLITIATPWLGAPKAINVLETGQFLDPSTPVNLLDYIIDPFINAKTRSIFKTLSEHYSGVHELVPSKTYFDLAKTSPYNYHGKALNYDEMTTLLDQQFQDSKPGLTNRAFHGRPDQDDWSKDTSGVEYHHLYGLTRIAKTVGTVVQRNVASCDRSLFKCSLNSIFDVVLTPGDQTVPVLSARRNEGLNAPGVSIQTGKIRGFFCTQNCSARDHLYDHTGLLINDDVQAEVLRILQAPFQPSTANEKAIKTQKQTVVDEPEAEPAYQVRVIGAASAMVLDSQGNSTNPMADPPDSGVLNVTSYLLNEHSFLSVIPMDQPYGIILRSGDEPMSVELTQGTDVSTTHVVRYQDLLLPAGVTAKLQISPQSVDLLRYDKDGDGSFETPVIPTVSVSGTVALDTEPPFISASQSAQGSSVVVTLIAADPGSGVEAMYYSTDGTNYHTYTGPITINPWRKSVLYAFADDNLANRSGLLRLKVVSPLRSKRLAGAKTASAVTARQKRTQIYVDP